MAHTPQIASIPGYVLYDTDLSSDAKVFCAMILAESATDGCHLKNAELAKKLGWSIGKIKKLLEQAIQGGYVVEEENGSRTLVVNFVKQEKVELPAAKPRSKDIFDKRNIHVLEKDINHLVNIFIKASINPTISSSQAVKNRFFANPYNRAGAKNIIVAHGLVKAEEVINKLESKIKDRFCPKPKSLYSLWEKWERVLKYIDGEKDIVSIK